MRAFAFLLILVSLAAAGCARNNKPAVKNAGAVGDPSVLRVAAGGQTVSSKEIIGSLIEYQGAVVPLVERFRPMARGADRESFKAQAGPELERILIARVSHILLFEQAKREMGDRAEQALEKQVEREVRDFILNRFEGDSARAEQYLKENGMDWKSFREQQKKTIAGQYYISTRLPKDRPVTYSELLERYNEIKDKYFVTLATIRFQLIDIETRRLIVVAPNQSQLQLARGLAAELMRRIGAGADFSGLADPQSGVSFVGLSEPVQPESLAKPYDVLAAEAEKIEPGEIAGPLEADGGEHLLIMKLEDKRPKGFRPLAEVQRQVDQMVVAQRQQLAVEEIEAKFRRQAELTEKDAFIDFCLEEIYRLSNQ